MRLLKAVAISLPGSPWGPAGHQHGSVGQDGGVVLTAAEVHGRGRLPFGLSLVEIDDFGSVCGQQRLVQTATDVDHFAGVVHHGRRVIAGGSIPIRTWSPGSTVVDLEEEALALRPRHEDFSPGGLDMKAGEELQGVEVG